MSAPISILYRGSNKLIALALYLEDGSTALLVSSLTYARIRLYQGATLVATYVHGTDGELRTDPDDTNQLLLELTTALVDALTVNLPLTARLDLKVTDEDFEEEPDAFADVKVFTIASNVL